MTDRPLRLGPDPNRTYLERQNAMYPDRYGQPGATGNESASDPRWSNSEDLNYYGPGLVRSPGNELLDAATGLIVLALAAALGFVITVTAYRLTHPEHLTAAWLLGYVATFVASTLVSAIVLHAVRRIIWALILAAIAFGIGSAAWRLWLA